MGHVTFVSAGAQLNGLLTLTDRADTGGGEAAAREVPDDTRFDVGADDREGGHARRCDHGGREGRHVVSAQTVRAHLWLVVALGAGCHATPRRPVVSPRPRPAPTAAGIPSAAGFAPAPVAVDTRFCKRLEHDNQKWLGLLDARMGCFPPQLGCHVVHGVGWGFVVRDARGSVGPDGCTVHVLAAVVRATAHEQVTPSEISLALQTEGQPGFQARGANGDITVLGDWDGDGNDEIAVFNTFKESEGESGGSRGIWSIKGGHAIKYPHTDNIGGALQDIDGDGKVDVLVGGPYDGIASRSTLSGEAYPVAPSIFALHVTPSGTLEANDATGRSFTQRQCAAAPPPDKYDSPEVSALQVVCARLQGKTAAEALDVQRARGCVDFLGDVHRYPQSCSSALPKLAAITPPFLLPKSP